MTRKSPSYVARSEREPPSRPPKEVPPPTHPALAAELARRGRVWAGRHQPDGRPAPDALDRLHADALRLDARLTEAAERLAAQTRATKPPRYGDGASDEAAA